MFVLDGFQNALIGEKNGKAVYDYMKCVKIYINICMIWGSPVGHL